MGGRRFWTLIGLGGAVLVAAGVPTLLPVHALGRALGGAAAGVAAVRIFALLPASSQLSGVDNLDHQAAVALLATCWLLSPVRKSLPGSSSRAPRAGLHG